MTGSWHHRRVKFLKAFSILLLLNLTTSCRDKNRAEEKPVEETSDFFKSEPQEVLELESNRLAEEPTDFLRSHSDNKINWQPWTSDVLEQAERSQKLILVFLGSTIHAQSFSLAQLLDEKLADQINERYLPVMADTELDPALSLASQLLAIERKDAIAFPFLIWLSHEGNPVAWLPLSSTDEEQLLLGFERAQNTVLAIQEDSSRYVVENSRYDNEGRVKRIAARLASVASAEIEPSNLSELFTAAQSLADLYDTINQTFDNTGGIPPGNLITTLARVSAHPSAPERLTRTSRKAAKESIELLVRSATRDPLDGYFFVRRASRTFAIPALAKSLETQAEMLSAMASSPSTPASKLALNQLLASLASHPLQGLSLVKEERNERAFFWDIKTLEEILSEDELAVARATFDLRSLGNIPSGDDPLRNYFRLNTLGLSRFGPELGKALGVSTAEGEELRQAVIEKIAARRQEILADSGGLLKESTPSLSSQARLLTALARLQASQPSPEAFAAMNTTGNAILQSHRDDAGRLLRVPTQAGQRTVPAFGNDYALTIEALLEWYRLTWDPQLLEKADDLAAIFLDEFVDEKNYPLEVSVKRYPLNFPIYYRSMIFGPSTWGTCFGFLEKLSSLGLQQPEASLCLEAITPHLDSGLNRLPVIHTDYLLNAVNTVEGYVLVLSKNQQKNASLRQELAQAEFDSVFAVVEAETFSAQLPVGGQAAVLFKNGESLEAFPTAEAIPKKLRAILAQ